MIDLADRVVPLSETEDPEPLDAAAFEEYRDQLRNLVVAGGRPYVLVILNEETDELKVTHVGIKPEGLPTIFQFLADEFANEQLPETD